MRLPSLKFLKTFQVAAKLKSFKAAAEELFVTPSAVSHQIKALEEQLGVALFERGVRTLTADRRGRPLSRAHQRHLLQARIGDRAAAGALRPHHHTAERAAVLRE